MRIQSIALLALCTVAVLAVPHKVRDERHAWKNGQESSSSITTPTSTPALCPTLRPTPSIPPGDDDDDNSGEFPFPWPTKWPPIFDDFPGIGDNDDLSLGDKFPSGVPGVERNKHPWKASN
ncbi:hypothetical protein BDV26DRAFT_295456 [Aspergillus bertholletiae]|uniref:Uncharacterized protein n=1 Tax=Aspergillus bertholletiae TaxID=1226010 RepID=A0A5N7B0Z0_9EURO|nr:hypothetical protein BDV26DRAFT_295456 [Aspergillus bertholletiae]